MSINLSEEGEAGDDKGKEEYKKCLDLIEHYNSRLEKEAIKEGRDRGTFITALLQITLGNVFNTCDTKERVLITRDYVIDWTKSFSERAIQFHSKEKEESH